MERTKLTVRISLVVLLLLFTGSCSTPTMRTSSDGDLSAATVAVIKSGAFTEIERIDEIRVPHRYLNVTALPGTHTIEIGFVSRFVGNKLLYPVGTATLQFRAEPGRTYTVNTDAIPESTWMSVVVLRFEWIAYVTDTTTGRKVAQSDPMPLRAEYVEPWFNRQQPF